jgi:hypothetical protein
MPPRVLLRNDLAQQALLMLPVNAPLAEGTGMARTVAALTVHSCPRVATLAAHVQSAWAGLAVGVKRETGAASMVLRPHPGLSTAATEGLRRTGSLPQPWVQAVGCGCGPGWQTVNTAFWDCHLSVHASGVGSGYSVWLNASMLADYRGSAGAAPLVCDDVAKARKQAVLHPPSGRGIAVVSTPSFLRPSNKVARPSSTGAAAAMSPPARETPRQVKSQPGSTEPPSPHVHHAALLLHTLARQA